MEFLRYKATNFCWKCSANTVLRLGQKCFDCRVRDRILRIKR